eukprot:TRINITY_DN2938_c0_g2_i3.p1 TRINITY_DN2938_c0_g2~~TRINITY_DN2938_c0_g2_i3.p1  ORF type:complete len:284 (-),score=67.41 TRINITY_DN2938_c0_g2_i3:33-884(-)
MVICLHSLLLLMMMMLLLLIGYHWGTEITDGVLVLVVGGIGLLVNVVGLWMFSGHAHAHGPSGGHDHDHGHGHGDGHENMHGIFLHVLGDFLGSVGVMISGSIIAFTEWQDRFIVDPIISLMITLLILKTTIPLVKRCSLILLQSVPDHIDMGALREKLEKVQNVEDIHDLHVWQLADTKVIGSVHIRCPESESFTQIANDMKFIFHEFGIHASTIQPEFDCTGSGCNSLCAEDCTDINSLCCPPEQTSSQELKQRASPRVGGDKRINDDDEHAVDMEEEEDD